MHAADEKHPLAELPPGSHVAGPTQIGVAGRGPRVEARTTVVDEALAPTQVLWGAVDGAHDRLGPFEPVTLPGPGRKPGLPDWPGGAPSR